MRCNGPFSQKCSVRCNDPFPKIGSLFWARAQKRTLFWALGPKKGPGVTLGVPLGGSLLVLNVSLVQVGSSLMKAESLNCNRCSYALSLPRYSPLTEHALGSAALRQ